MPSWLGWILQALVDVKPVWKTVATLLILVTGGTWVANDYLHSVQVSNLRSEAATLRTDLESARAELDRTQRQLTEREALVASLKSNLEAQSADKSSIPKELSRAWANLGLSPEKFRDLPLHWRQALGELALAPRADFPALSRFVRELRPDDILLIDRVAPAIAHNGSVHFLVRSRTSPHRHPHLGLEFADFRRLREIGLFHSEFSRIGTRVSPSDAAPVSAWGSTVALAIYSSAGEVEVEFPVETFTDAGAALIELLRVPSDLRYFAWVADTVRDSTVDVQLWAFSPDPDSPDEIVPGMGRIEIVRLR